MRLLMTRALWIALLHSASGCSYAFVHGPRPVEESAARVPDSGGASVACTSSNAVPILDTVIAVPLLGAGAVGIVGGAAGTCKNGCYGPTSTEILVIGAVLTTLGTFALSSAVSGYGRTADCRRLHQEITPGLPVRSSALPDLKEFPWPVIRPASTEPVREAETVAKDGATP